ncbi:hypothetical protein ATL39_3036 [Sinobaca qinghaiensis]|uniref:Uncharacterized protein n=1 Tax=Sinobaca qinghaiensis TaxID=342944 RepID=A0A419UWU4_9BACL|nr:hypothetical protein [Sinobaca qinghaiensis]RKD69612.1 hypothetical protein ATL39_3036 [Sinobaca qinghaiensis]
MKKKNAIFHGLSFILGIFTFAVFFGVATAADSMLTGLAVGATISFFFRFTVYKHFKKESMTTFDQDFDGTKNPIVYFAILTILMTGFLFTFEGLWMSMLIGGIIAAVSLLIILGGYFFSMTQQGYQLKKGKWIVQEETKE